MLLPPRCFAWSWAALAVVLSALLLMRSSRKSSTWMTVAPFIPDQPIKGSRLALKPDDPNGWTRSIDFLPAGPFIKNLTGVHIERLSYTVTSSGDYPCEHYRDATLKYGINGAAERFSEQDSHALGNVFARVQIGASWELRRSKPLALHSCL